MRRTVKIFALITALFLIASQPLSALPGADSQSEAISGAPLSSTTATRSSGIPSVAQQSDAALDPSADVNLQFELLPAALAGESKLMVQLDGEQTGTSLQGGNADYSFSDLRPGMHTARLIMMDARNQPLQGGIATVRFRVNPAATQKPAPTAPQELRGAEPGPPPIPPELRNDGDPGYPMKGSPLPLVSLIGFMLLIGGILPAMRPRKTTIAHPCS